MDIECNLEKIEFIQKNSSFFIDNAHTKINQSNNVSTALLTILLSEKKLEECRNYPLLEERIIEYEGNNFYNDFISVISNLKTYVNRIFNYDQTSIEINEALDNIISIYNYTRYQKEKRMA